MSKSGIRRASGPDYPEYPDIQEEFGENPAHYLLNPDETAFALIRGISNEERLDAWYQVEEDLGPRKDVIKALNEQREAIR